VAASHSLISRPTEVMTMKRLDHYCETLRCKMNKEACIGRQLLAIKPHYHRLGADSLLVSEGFYPECYGCIRGRRLARACGINIGVLRKEIINLRHRIEESPWVGYSRRRLR
jgi:hypothetical protein